MSSIKELEKQVNLIEMDAGIQPNMNRHKEMTNILVRVHDLKLQLTNIEESNPKYNSIKEAIAYHYGELIKIQQHPQAIFKFFSKNRWLKLKDKLNVFLDSYTGILWPRKTTEFPYKKLSLEEKNRALFDFHIDGYKKWKLPTVEVLKFLLSHKNFPYYYDRTITICEQSFIWVGSGNKPNYACNIRANYSVQTVNSALFLPYSNDLFLKSYITNHSENGIFVLQLLLTHNLKVVFDNKSIETLYKQHYEKLYDLLLQMHALNNANAPITLREQKQLKQKTINLFVCNKDFNETKLNTSVLSYYPAAGQLLQELITFISTTEKSNKHLSNL